MNEVLAKKITQSAENYYRNILGLSDWSKRAEARLQRAYERHMFGRLVKFAGPLAEKSVLDLGSGWGGVVLEAAIPAKLAVGIEPDTERLAIANELLKSDGPSTAKFVQGFGEHLPFPDNSFDVVASYQVLEHVQDPAQVVAEVSRVLKRGGVFHFSTPNYMAFWEPHYKLFWLPLLPKALGRLYLRLRRRQTGFLAHLNYVNPLGIRQLLRKEHFDFVDLCHQRAVAKSEIILSGWFSRLPGWRRMMRILHPVVSRLVFLIHTCFLNRDQEYVATKA